MDRTDRRIPPAERPAFATATYGPLALHGPFRRLTAAQEATRARMGRKLVNVNAQGVAAVEQPILGYANRQAWVRPDGTLILEDAYTQAGSRSFHDAE